MNGFNKISEAKRELGMALLDQDHKLPCSFYFQENIPGRKFKVTIEEVEEDFFYDKNGVKWIKADES